MAPGMRVERTVVCVIAVVDRFYSAQQMSNYTVGYFVGSLARASINRKLALALTRLAPSQLHMREIPIAELPLYSYDYDKNYPPAGRALKEAIDAVDAVLFVTPE